MPQRNSAPSRCLLSEMVVLALALFQVAWQIHSCKLQVCWAKTPQYPTTSVFSCHYNYIYLPLHSVHQSFRKYWRWTSMSHSTKWFCPASILSSKSAHFCQAPSVLSAFPMNSVLFPCFCQFQCLLQSLEALA